MFARRGALPQPATTAPSWRQAFTRAVALLLIAGAFTLPAAARDALPMAEDPALEARVLAVAEGLRCVVCQNETLAASHADLARDLRAQIREQLRAGRTPGEITGFMVDRYGDFVLYRPPLRATTALLWAGPFALLAIALGWWWRRVRRTGAPAGLSAEEARRVQQLLDERGPR